MIILCIYLNCVLTIGSNAGSKETPPSSSSKKPSNNKEKEEKPKESIDSKDKEKGKKLQSSFPPANTTDSVRLKCRELLTNALRTDGRK